MRRPTLHSDRLADMLDADELQAFSLIQGGLGIDLTKAALFWEAVVARLTGGTLTPHGCQWDIDLERRRIEVKFSREFPCRFAKEIRPVFKYARPRGLTGKERAHVLVLIGIRSVDEVYSWVAPMSAVPHARSITLTSPRSRAQTKGSASAWFDRFSCPPLQILPEVLRAYRAERASTLHVQNAAENRRKGKAIADFFGEPSPAERDALRARMRAGR